MLYDVFDKGRQMKKLDAKSLVTVRSVREANTRFMARDAKDGRFVDPGEARSRYAGASKGDVAAAGRTAMNNRAAKK